MGPLGFSIAVQKCRVLLTLLLICLFSSSAHAEEPLATPRVIDGVIHIDTWNPIDDGPLSLNGKWKFAWNQFLDFESITQSPPPDLKTIDVPAKWNAPPSDREATGYGTYVLRIKRSQAGLLEIPPLSFSAASVCCASRLEVWDEARNIRLSFTEQGKPAKDKNDEISKMNMDAYASWSAMESGSLLLIMHVSNHVHARPGLLHAPQLELASAASDRILKNYLINAGVCGILIIVGLYHLTLFMQRRDDRLSLTFSLLCGAMLIRSLLTSSILDHLTTTHTPLGSEVLLRLEYLSIPLIALTGLLYIHTMNPSELKRKTVKYWGFGCGGLLCVLACVLPTITLTHQLNMILTYFLIAITLIFSFVCHDALKKKTLANWMLFSLVVVVLSFLNDTLYAKQLVQTGYIASYGFMIFILIQSGIIARTFVSAMEERDFSSRTLLKTYQQLDDELLKREKLVSINQQLKRENETAAEQLAQAEKMSTLGQLVAGVAHEIAGPTNYIGMATGLIQENVQAVRARLEAILSADVPEAQQALQQFTHDLDEADSNLKNINNGVGTIKHIHAALRNHSRSDPLPQFNLEIQPIINEVLVILGGKLKVIKVEVDTSGAPTFTGRRSQIGQVLTNLIGNAADAIEAIRVGQLQTKKDYVPQINIEAKAIEYQGEPHLEVAVHDNGPGIPLDLRKRILEPFFTTKDVGEGTGLGMSIIHRIIQDHRGELKVEDSSELGGACLRFVIPTTPPKETGH